MSLEPEKKRLLTAVENYVGSLPPPSPVEAPLPNNAARASAGVTTKTKKYGVSKMSDQGKANVSQPKK